MKVKHQFLYHEQSADGLYKRSSVPVGDIHITNRGSLWCSIIPSVQNDCSTFAELQNTEYKFTIGGECYVNLSGEWITKDRWYFYKAFNR